MIASFKGKKIDIVDVDGIDTRDYPDFVDAFISSAYWVSTGEDLTYDEIEELNDDRELVMEAVFNRLF